MMLSVLRPFLSPLLSRHGINLDFPLLAGYLALLSLSLVMVTSASSEMAAVQSGNPPYFSVHHLIYLVIDLISCGLTIMIPTAIWQRWDWKLLLVALGLLVLVITPGTGREINGSMRWTGFGLSNIQPSGIAKICVVIFIVGHLIRRQQEVRENWMGFFKPFMVLLSIVGLLLHEPDFSTIVVMMSAATAVLFLGGVGLFRFGLTVPLAVGAVVLPIQTRPYRMARLTSFTDLWADRLGTDYQLSQALIAFSRGDWLGMELSNSIQKQFYLPETHTDFVSAVFAGELGIIGALATIALFVFVNLRTLYIDIWVEQAKQFFSAYMTYGLASLWIDQFLINIRVNVGLPPTKSLTLPSLSYSGSSLVICYVCLGMLLRIEWER